MEKYQYDIMETISVDGEVVLAKLSWEIQKNGVTIIYGFLIPVSQIHTVRNIERRRVLHQHSHC